MLKLFNTLTRKIENFIPQNPQEVKIYTCGPTVYAYPHIGNFTSYIYWDLLQRVLINNGYSPKRILNLTDVGHLSSDADDGIDKLEKGAQAENKTVWEIAEYYSDYFLRNYRKLNLLEPAKICRATDYIDENISLINLLAEKGFTYELSDGIYFDTSKFPRYADFAKLDLEHLKAGARVDFNNEKHNVSDFALWKFIKDGESHAMRWKYLNRFGYPGWHIECAAIIHKELGETIDIHTGGIDHIPIHHTNEIAQSEAAFDKKLSNYWLHCNFITIDNEKISKSLGNTYRIEELEEKGFSPLDFKLWVLQGHYQSARNFNFSDLSSAKSRRLNWKNKAAFSFQTNSETPPFVIDDITNALNDNLNSAKAFSIIDNSKISFSDWEKLNTLFGLDITDTISSLPSNIQNLINDREKARQDKDFSTADHIRSQLATHNLTIKDTEFGPVWEYLS